MCMGVVCMCDVCGCGVVCVVCMGVVGVVGVCMCMGVGVCVTRNSKICFAGTHD